MVEYKAVVVWAWSHHGDQHVESLRFDSQEIALRVALALLHLQDVFLYSAVRVFRAPDLLELSPLPSSTSFLETRPLQRGEVIGRSDQGETRDWPPDPKEPDE